MSRRRFSCGGVFAALVVTVALSACGSSAEQNPGEPRGDFPVQVTSSFPAHQRLAQETKMIVSVKNTGHRTLPDVAVTVTDPDHKYRYADAAQSFGELIPENGAGQPLLASRSRPIWIINRTPGSCGFSCKQLGPGGAASAYTDTWALGRLAPGKTATFAWQLTAIQAGTYKVEYQVAAGLNGYAKAVTSGGKQVEGTYEVTISNAPPSTYVENNGTVASSS